MLIDHDGRESVLWNTTEEGFGVAKALNWSKLPPKLAWVALPAERYGHYQFDEPILAFLRAATALELVDLRAIQRRWIADHSAIQAWLDEYNMTVHPEAQRVYFTQVLLGMADEARVL